MWSVLGELRIRVAGMGSACRRRRRASVIRAISGPTVVEFAQAGRENHATITGSAGRWTGLVPASPVGAVPRAPYNARALREMSAVGMAPVGNRVSAPVAPGTGDLIARRSAMGVPSIPVVITAHAMRWTAPAPAIPGTHSWSAQRSVQEGTRTPAAAMGSAARMGAAGAILGIGA